MTELQEKLVKMMGKFHEMCEQNDLRYYVLGGTALGVARHEGFIPWDDDVDVGMPRKDYEKLKTIAQEQILENYRFEFPNEAKDFVYAFGKMYDTTTTLVENVRYKTKRGIYIDIFPLDGAGNTYEESVQYFKKIDKKVNLLMLKTCAWRKGRKLFKNIAMLAMRCVPEFIISTNKIKADMDAACKALDFDDCAYVANYNGAWHEKEISKKEWLGTPQKRPFEDIVVYCPEDVDSYLTAIYGDWRKLPPLEKQVTHHDYLYLNLTKSYLE